MRTSLYKYVGSSYLDRVLDSTEHVTLKCSCPEAFNDPYELFLTVDFNDDPEILAFYADVIGDLPQIPTTCFSRSPIVVPMWAHYAEEFRGFVIEFNESKMAEFFPKSDFGDVDYRDKPDGELSDLLHTAYERKKFRHSALLDRGVFSAAYYTKATCWKYEKEKRMIVRNQETRTDEDLILFDVPKECVTGLICGPRASTETVGAVREKADQLCCRYLDLKIGKTSVVPFFQDSDGQTLNFSGSTIRTSKYSCGSCGEPVGNHEGVVFLVPDYRGAHP